MNTRSNFFANTVGGLGALALALFTAAFYEPSPTMNRSAQLAPVVLASQVVAEVPEARTVVEQVGGQVGESVQAFQALFRLFGKAEPTPVIEPDVSDLEDHEDCDCAPTPQQVVDSRWGERTDKK